MRGGDCIRVKRKKAKGPKNCAMTSKGPLLSRWATRERGMEDSQPIYVSCLKQDPRMSLWDSLPLSELYAADSLFLKEIPERQLDILLRVDLPTDLAWLQGPG